AWPTPSGVWRSARHAPPFATMAVVCRGPPAKGSPPTAFLRAQTNDHCAFQCPAELAFGVLLRQPRNQHADAVHLLALLRVRRERPGSRAAEQRDELTTLQAGHATTSHWADHGTLSLQYAGQAVLGADLKFSESVWGVSWPVPRE